MVQTKLRRNAVFAVLGRGWSIVLGLVSTPYIISQVGINAYGVWVLLESIIAYFSLSEMGVGSSFNKYIAEYHVKADDEKMSAVISAGFFFYLSLAFLLFSLSWAIKTPLLDRFDFSAVTPGEVDVVYAALVAVLCLRMLSSPFRSVIAGMLRYDIINTAFSLTQTLSLCGILLALHLGYGIPGLAVNAFCYALLDLSVAVVIAFRLESNLRLRANRQTVEMFRRLFRYGLSIQVVAVGEVINEQIDKILLGIFRNVALVGMYEIGAKIANMANSLVAIVLNILVPTTSQLQAAGRSDEIRRLYLRGTGLVALLIIPVTTIVAMHAEQMVSLWLGKNGFMEAAVAARFLIMGLASYLIVGVGRLMSRGLGIPEYEMKSGLLISAVNLVLSLMLVKHWGLYGAVVASMAALFLGSGFFMFRFNGQLQVPSWKVWRLIAWPLMFAVLAGLPSLWLPPPAEWSLLAGLGIRLQAFVYLATTTVMTAALYISMFILSGRAHEYDDLRVLLNRISGKG